MKSLRLYFAIAVGLQFVWGFVPSASKLVIDEIPVELYVALRWTISGAIFAAYLTLTKSWKKMRAADFAAVATLGVLGYGAASLGTLYGLKVGGVANFAMMNALEPLMTSALSIAILRERPTRSFYLALIFSVTGLTLLVNGKSQISSWSSAMLAAACILGGAILEALVFVFSKKFKARVPAAQYLATAQLAAAAALWIAQLTLLHQTPQLAGLSWQGASAALFVSIVACVLCYAVLYWLLNFVDGHRLALVDGVHTLSATFFGWLFFADPITPLMLLGGVMILMGLIGGAWPHETVE